MAKPPPSSGDDPLPAPPSVPAATYPAPPSAPAATYPLPLPLPTTPSSPYAPSSCSPLTPTGTRPRLGPRRLSRFTEEPMTARTPAASVSEPSFDQYWFGPSAENVNTNTEERERDVNGAGRFPGRLDVDAQLDGDGAGMGMEMGKREAWVRGLNGVVHAVLGVVVLSLVGCGMQVLREGMARYMSIQAVLLICFLSFDVILDGVTLLRARTRWPIWGLALRVVCGTAYIILSLVGVGTGGVFPEGHTYWNLSADSASTVVYVLLCVEGLWNLLHIPVCRYHLGRPLLRRTTPEKRPPSSHLGHHRTSFNPRFSVAGTEYSSISLTWRRWVRTRSTQYSREDLTGGISGMHRAGTREPSVDLTLRERPGEEDDEDDRRSNSSRGTSPHGRREAEDTGKKAEAGLERSDKVEEGKAEEAQQPYSTRSADIGQ